MLSIRNVLCVFGRITPKESFWGKCSPANILLKSDPREQKQGTSEAKRKKKQMYIILLVSLDASHMRPSEMHLRMLSLRSRTLAPERLWIGSEAYLYIGVRSSSTLGAIRYTCGKLFKACTDLVTAVDATRNEVFHRWCLHMCTMWSIYGQGEQSTTEV